MISFYYILHSGEHVMTFSGVVTLDLGTWLHSLVCHVKVEEERDLLSRISLHAVQLKHILMRSEIK